MPSPDTWTYWALTSRQLHFYLSLGILFVLAGTVSVSNFLNTNEYGRQVQWDWHSPGESLRSFGKMWKASVEAESKRVAEARKRLVEDVEKRGEYRRAHGLEKAGEEGGFGDWAVRDKDMREHGKQVLVEQVLAEQTAKAEAEKR
ncbi:hypothetical protein FN846DRAFT_779395 [Sphaerosporella brunnea]|uniref:Uncharacterized protein n=1 Tax=Sphaerosporella brunnea TaxID=1250544 RepID=A0A5J5EUV3_9PEZI|nr:hypothetical protein FN846DRAFT_779395 [Sphaerosporella brunnea]